MTHQKKILVVDDDVLTCKLVSKVLVRRGYDVTIAENGLAGFEKAVAWHPDLVITDVMMPELDGLGMIRQMRGHPNLALIPVIILSQKGGAEDRVRGFRLGADHYLPKPFYPEELIHCVRRCLEKSEKLSRQVMAQFMRSPVRPTPVPDPPDLTGDLSNIGVSTLLTVMQLEKKSGNLELINDKQVARLVFRDGNVISGSVLGKIPLINEEAVYNLLLWKAGHFTFKKGDVTEEDLIGKSTHYLLMEGARRLDEAADQP